MIVKNTVLAYSIVEEKHICWVDDFYAYKFRLLIQTYSYMYIACIIQDSIYA